MGVLAAKSAKKPRLLTTVGMLTTMALVAYSSPTKAFDPLAEYRGTIWGIGIGDGYGGLIGGAVGRQIDHHQVDLSLGVVGFGARYRYNIWMFELGRKGSMRLVPTASAGFGPSNWWFGHDLAAAKNDEPLLLSNDDKWPVMSVHGIFVQAGGSLCKRRFCLSAEYGPHVSIGELSGEIYNGARPEWTIGLDFWAQ